MTIHPHNAPPDDHDHDPGHDRPGFPVELRRAVTEALTRTEAGLHEYGWDQPPALVGIFHRRLSTLDDLIEVDGSLFGAATWHRRDRSARQPLRVTRHRVQRPARQSADVHPVDVLLSLGDDLILPPLRPWLRDWLHRDGRRLIGFGFCFEGWQAPIRPGYRHGGLADAPAEQRTEIRAVAALDLHHHAYQIIRRRGAVRPEVTTGDTPSWQVGDSRILTGLHRLNEVARAH